MQSVVVSTIGLFGMSSDVKRRAKHAKGQPVKLLVYECKKYKKDLSISYIFQLLRSNILQETKTSVDSKISKLVWPGPKFSKQSHCHCPVHSPYSPIERYELRWLYSCFSEHNQ